MARLLLVFCILLILLPTISAARTWYITPDGTGDVATIQIAVNSAAEGDTVLLATGVYTGLGNHDIEIAPKAITICSETGVPSDCIVDCEATPGDYRRAFYLKDGAPPGLVIEGLTAENGYQMNGSGIYMYNQCRPTIRNCVFANNWAGAGGAGIYLEQNCCPVIEGCSFRGNHAQHGAGVLFHSSWDTVPVRDCVFEDNSAFQQGGAVYCTSANCRVEGCLFRGNSAATRGGVFFLDACTATIESCTLFGNSAGSGAAAYCYYNSHLVGSRDIISSSDGSPTIVCDESSHALLECCDLYGNSHGDWVGCIASQAGVNGNFSACPSFCNAEAEPYDLHLCDQSPCSPGNHPYGYDCGLIGAFGLGCDCGPSSTQPSTWGSIKAQFKN